MTWWVYYEDNVVFSSGDGSPEDTPVRDVVCIACNYSDTTAHSCDYYFFNAEEGYWYGATLDGLLYHLMRDASNVIAVRKGSSRRHLDNYMSRAFEARTS